MPPDTDACFEFVVTLNRRRTIERRPGRRIRCGTRFLLTRQPRFVSSRVIFGLPERRWLASNSSLIVVSNRCVCSASRTGRTLLPVVVTAARHLQDSTPLLNAPLGAVLGDEAVACHYCPSEKMLTAFFRMSRSRVTRPSSRRRRRTSSSRSLRWPVPGKASSPRSRSGFFHD